MPDIDLSQKIPPTATWIKLHYVMKAVKPEAQLIARVWSGSKDNAVVLKGASGDVFVQMGQPQKLTYQRPVTVDLIMKVVAYKEV